MYHCLRNHSVTSRQRPHFVCRPHTAAARIPTTKYGWGLMGGVVTFSMGIIGEEVEKNMKRTAIQKPHISHP
jgi:hypothetical protein